MRRELSMSPERGHEQIEGLLAAYALDAVEPDERELVRAHLDGCASCTAALSRLERTRDLIPLAVDAVEPPRRLRESILTAAASSAPSRGQAISSGPVRRQPPRLRLRSPVRSRLTAGVAAAAVIAFALGGGLGLGIGRSLTPAAPASTVAQYRLSGSGDMAGASGQVYELRGQGLTLVEFRNLPPVPAGKVYELWLIPSQGNPIPAGVFSPDQGGSHVVVLARGLQD